MDKDSDMVRNGLEIGLGIGLGIGLEFGWSMVDAR